MFQRFGFKIQHTFDEWRTVRNSCHKSEKLVAVYIIWRETNIELAKLSYPFISPFHLSKGKDKLSWPRIYSVGFKFQVSDNVRGDLAMKQVTRATQQGLEGDNCINRAQIKSDHQSRKQPVDLLMNQRNDMYASCCGQMDTDSTTVLQASQKSRQAQPFRLKAFKI